MIQITYLTLPIDTLPRKTNTSAQRTPLSPITSRSSCGEFLLRASRFASGRGRRRMPAVTVVRTYSSKPQPKSLEIDDSEKIRYIYETIRKGFGLPASAKLVLKESKYGHDILQYANSTVKNVIGANATIVAHIDHRPVEQLCVTLKQADPIAESSNILIKPTLAVHELKAAIARTKGIAADDQLLQLDGKTIEDDDDVLANISIGQECVVELSSAAKMDHAADSIVLVETVANGMTASFGSLLESGAASDFKIACPDANGGEPHYFKVHRTVLIARSPVLSAMLLPNAEGELSSEAKEGVIKADETDAEMMRSLVDFFYKGSCSIQLKNLANLMRAADWYGQLELKEKCEQLMAERLSVENAVDWLLIADRHRAQTLRQAALKFFKRKAPVLSADPSVRDKLCQSGNCHLLYDMWEASMDK